MLMGTNNSAVDERLFEIRILRQVGKDAMPYASPRPTGKALIDTVPRTELPGKIAPRASGAGNPQHRLDEQPVVGCGPARIAGLARQQRGYPLKLIVTQSHSTHPDSAKKSGYDHKPPPVNRGRQLIERKRLFSPLNPMAFRPDNECQQTLGTAGYCIRCGGRPSDDYDCSSSTAQKPPPALVCRLMILYSRLLRRGAVQSRNP